MESSSDGLTILQYDPNPRVRDSMTAIWRALVAEPRKAVDEHYSAIMKELLKVRGAVPVCLCATARSVPRLRGSPSTCGTQTGHCLTSCDVAF